MKIKLIVFVLISILVCAGNITGKNAENDSLQTDSSAAEKITKAEAAPPGKMDSGAFTDRQSSLPGVSNITAKNEWRLTAGKIFWSAVVFFSAFLVLRFLTNILETLSERWGRFRLFFKRTIPPFRIIFWTVILYEIITLILAPPLETIVAVSAAVGLSVGLASQDILKNIFGGIVILLDHPFQIGDKIQAGGYYGEVKQIGLRTVRIQTPDDNLVSIPNAEIMNQAVSNANAGEPNCQVVAQVYLPASVDTQKVREIAYLSAVTSRYVFLKKPVSVIMKNEMHLGKSVLLVKIKAYVLDIRYEFPFMSDMTEITLRELMNEGLITEADMAWYSPGRDDQKYLSDASVTIQ